MKTVGAILRMGAEFLEPKGVESPRVACELLLSRLLGCRRLELCLKYEEAVGEKHLEAMRRGIKRLAGGEPVQYILGQTEFMGHVFKTDRRALIPRPETEVLVETVLECGGLWKRERPAIVDVGTGSGCIAISLALAKPEALYIGLDVSADAVELARENAAALGAEGRIGFSCEELCDTLEPEMMDAVVANPPYIPTAEWERLPRHIREYEPRLALDGGPDGLRSTETLITDASMALKAGGFIFMEIDERKARAVQELLEASGFGDVRVKKDLAGKDRVVWAVLGSGGD